MRFVAQIVLAMAFAIGGDVVLYAYSFRNWPRPSYAIVCAFALRADREEQARSDRDMLRVSALLINGAALAYICGTLRRLRRDRDRIAGDGMTA